MICELYVQHESHTVASPQQARARATFCWHSFTFTNILFTKK